jgi:hypothetical protein
VHLQRVIAGVRLYKVEEKISLMPRESGERFVFPIQHQVTGLMAKLLQSFKYLFAVVLLTLFPPLAAAALLLLWLWSRFFLVAPAFIEDRDF